ncbi:MAG TPA: hypothetical protein VMU24_07965 [Candidatus Acidoferrales bacterium]|jgi:hypothetical protein|nr:hypothetical protein [Candidatus Acidoferrales bacterium]
MDRTMEPWRWSRDRWAWCLSLLAIFIIYKALYSASQAGGGDHYRSIITPFIEVAIFGGTYIRAMQVLVHARERLGQAAFTGLHLAFAFLCCMALVLVERLTGPTVALY